MTVLAEFKKLLPEHKCELMLLHQPHTAVYETVEEYFKNNIDNNSSDGPDYDYCTKEDREECVKTNEIWELHWYPNTPVGFCHCAAPTLERLFERIIA
jgi:hypothetical protein